MKKSGTLLVVLSLLMITVAPAWSAPAGGGDVHTLATVSQKFLRPTVGVIVKHFGASHKAVDIQSQDRPAAGDPACLAEPGSLDYQGDPLATGDWNTQDPEGKVISLGPDGICDDWMGAKVKAAAPGLVVFAGVKIGKDGSATHIVRINHGTLTDGQSVVTEYRHLGSKVRDASSGVISDSVTLGAPVQSFMNVSKGMVVFGGYPIGSQGYSGKTSSTHLEYVVKVGGIPANPEEWFSRTVDITPPSQLVSLTVRAFIDGHSQLIVRGDAVRWHHIDSAAPGRWDGARRPTYLNGYAWFPRWPDEPDSENRDCDCNSSACTGIAALPAVTQTALLQVVRARDEASIAQQPDANNKYTAVIDFNDPSGGAVWYEVRLYYKK